MNIFSWQSAIFIIFIIASSCSIAAEVQETDKKMSESTDRYVADKDTVRTFFDAVSAKLKRPVIVSNAALKKRISGHFDLANPIALVERVSQRMGLISYDDGQSLFIYDASEIKSTLVSLNRVAPVTVRNFLMSSGLYDERYPMRTDNTSHTFYVSGPPVYVSLIKDVAAVLDSKGQATYSGISLHVIPLKNTFVSDRTYRYRDEQVVIPGMATVIEKLIGKADVTADRVVSVEQPAESSSPQQRIDTVRALFPEAANIPPALLTPFSPNGRRAQEPVVVVANQDNNSLLVRGSAEQVRSLQQLIALLDMPRRHVEMSVWIVDLQKEQLDQLGVSLNGSLNLGRQLAVSFNGGSSTVDGASFMAAVTALAKEQKANIVSRPMILTQENIPAVFDNNRTFYTKLVGERTSNLEHVTYGTAISVLPRFSADQEIELLLSVEDGNQITNASDPELLPEVGRTTISTIARVPKGKSLLIGGYTRQENSETRTGIPGMRSIPLIGGLFRYQSQKQASLVRVFLIQPKEIVAQFIPENVGMMQALRGKSLNGDMFDWMDNLLAGKAWQSNARMP